MNKNKVLSLDNICVEYDSFKLRNVSFDIYSGEIVGFIGKNGAGKSTTINAIMGNVKLLRGARYFQGQKITDKNIDNFKQHVGYVGDVNTYFSNVKIKDVLGFVSSLYSKWDEKKFNHFVNDVFNINLNKKMKELSAGNKVKLNLSIAFSHDSDILILDEPTSGIDPIVRDEILEILRNYAKKENKPVLFSTHITEDIEMIADRIICISEGQVILNMNKKEALDEYVKISMDSISPENMKKLSEKSFEKNGDIFARKSLVDFSCKIKPVTLHELMLYASGGNYNV